MCTFSPGLRQDSKTKLASESLPSFSFPIITGEMAFTREEMECKIKALVNEVEAVKRNGSRHLDGARARDDGLTECWKYMAGYGYRNRIMRVEEACCNVLNFDMCEYYRKVRHLDASTAYCSRIRILVLSILGVN